MEYLLLLLLALPLPQKPPKTIPHSSVTCVMRNIGSNISHWNSEKKEVEEVEDWYVDCSILYNEKKIYAAALTLAHPSTFREAADAVEQFRTKRAAEIIKQYKDGTLKEPQ